MPDKLLRGIAIAERWLAQQLEEPERTRWLFALALFVITLAVWFPTLFYGLDLSNADDYFHITDAALHHTIKDVAGWFEHGYWAYYHYEYRPLTRLSLLLDYFVWGPRPLGYHLTNVLLHFACALLLGAIMVNAGAPQWGARLASVVWVFYPSGAMAVRWINGRQDVQCAALILAGIWFFTKWLNGRPLVYLAAAAASTVLAAFTKEPGVITPLFLLVVASVLPSRRPWLHRLGGVVVIGLLLVPYVLLRLRAWPLPSYQETYAGMFRPLHVNLRVFVRDLLAPAPYSLITTWRALGVLVIFAPNFWGLLAEQATFWGGLAVLLCRQRRLLLLGIMWKVIFFLPVYNLYWNPGLTHYRYLPSLGAALLVGMSGYELGRWGAARLRARARPAVRWGLVTIALAVLLGYYWVQLPLHWPTWRVIARGGIAPPRSFCRQIRSPEVRYGFTIPEPRAGSAPGAPSSGEGRKKGNSRLRTTLDESRRR